MNSKKKRIEKCAICGQVKPLTLEHIPPQCAFNKERVHIYPTFHHLGTHRKPWDLSDVPYEISQNGVKFHTLCEQCNNDTGSWYAADYGMYVNQYHRVVQEANPSAEQTYKIKIEAFYPLRIIKQVLTMFCSVNWYYSEAEELIALRNFVHEKKHLVLITASLDYIHIYTIQTLRNCLQDRRKSYTMLI